MLPSPGPCHQAPWSALPVPEVVLQALTQGLTCLPLLARPPPFLAFPAWTPCMLLTLRGHSSRCPPAVHLRTPQSQAGPTVAGGGPLAAASGSPWAVWLLHTFEISVLPLVSWKVTARPQTNPGPGWGCLPAWPPPRPAALAGHPQLWTSSAPGCGGILPVPRALGSLR